MLENLNDNREAESRLRQVGHKVLGILVDGPMNLLNKVYDGIGLIPDPLPTSEIPHISEILKSE